MKVTTVYSIKSISQNKSANSKYEGKSKGIFLAFIYTMVLFFGLKLEIENIDFTGGQIKTIGDFTYITAPLIGKTYFLQTREALDDVGNIVAERIWHPPQVWNISRIALIGGVEYGHSTANPQIYQLWKTNQYHDDSPTNDIVAYDVNMKMAYRQHDRRQGYLSFDKTYVEGYILRNSDLRLRVYNDYLDPAPQTFTIGANGDNPSLFPPTDVETIGGSIVGEQPVGGGEIDTTIMPKFRAIIKVEDKNCFEYQLELFSTGADTAWEILALGTNTQVAQSSPTFIIK
jgi:hypothetical protein